MAFKHSKESKFLLDTSGGTLTDLSGYVNNVNFPLNLDTAEVTPFNANSKQYVVGLKNCQFTAEVSWDPTVDGYLFELYGAPAGTFNYKPDGTVTYSGEAYLIGYTPSSSVNDAVKGSLTFQVDGDVARA